MSTQPTDAEILELASQYWYSLDETESETEIELVRAALAKWGRSLQQEVQKPMAWWIPKAEQFALADKSGDRPFSKAWEPLYAAPQPTQTQAGAVPLTDEMASKAGRALSDLYATECGVDKEDHWKVYGSDFIATAKLVLEAVGIKGGQHGTE